VVDILASSFDSAGQRCSALRVLCLQADVADGILNMLQGALRELSIGDPADVRTDIGPVIDADAREGLERHVSAMQLAGARITRLALPDTCDKGSFVAPTIIEIGSMSELGREQFGPILHVLRYRAAEFDRLIDDINASGYGLTMGVHSRIDETIARVVARAHVGNLYVNRNIIGAVVGVQPFGGEGLSGTGPKAGGPLYLHRLLRRSPGPVLEQAAQLADSEAFRSFVDWLEGDARALIEGDDIAVLRDRADACRERRLAGLRLVFQGPTGEDNSLSFVPRGLLAGAADSCAGYLHQILAAAATGNRIVFADTPMLKRLQQSLPPAVASQVSLDAKWFEAPFGALLFDGTEPEADTWRKRLAARDGPLVALVLPEPEYDPGALVHERTVSVNTAAAGGNASLMAMGA
jgi:RHH-type proline utilization regulon transcriptional repressor/proline dehydrogenase/delta 1-pyrroline-5-carboxylate dehydrogenase